MAALSLKLYSMAMRLAQPLLRRKLQRRGVLEAGYLQAIPERFGYYEQASEQHSQLVWVHAVSLGETRTAAVLLGALRRHNPGLRVLLTHGTATGREEGRALLQPGDIQVWQPWDSAPAVARFFAHFKPRLGLLMETEVWPNLMGAAQARQIPMLLVNARLSAKSLAQAQRLASLSVPAFKALTAVYAQTAADADRLRSLGAPVAGVFGNLKFDAEPDEAQQAIGRAWRQQCSRPVILLASSRDGEEAGWLAAIRAMRKPGGSADAAGMPAASGHAQQGGKIFQPMIVPRHPQRFDEVQSVIEKLGFSVSRRSSWADGPASDPSAQTADVWLGDSLGEMALYYSLSDAALLGGSFEPLGGQNLIEAAACGCPVVMGPHTFNFSEAAVLAEEAGAALRAPDLQAGAEMALALVREPSARGSRAATCRSFAASHRGAVVRTIAALEAFLPK